MYRVIIVDDEKQIVDGLCRMIKWPELGFEVCATARNGMEAIPLIKSYKADLVMTDIRMPVMDGLKMVEHVRKNISEEAEFIILSGFGEFQYAQKALQYNVKSYILKPIDEAELYGILVDIKNYLDEKEIRKSLKIKNDLIDFISGEGSNASEPNLESETAYGLRYIVVERHEDICSLLSYQDEQKHSDLGKFISEKIGQSKMRFVVQHDRNSCHMIAGESLLKCFEYNIKHLAASIHEFLSKHKSTQANILIGEKVSSFKELYRSAQSISMCRNKLFYSKNPSIILYDDIKEEKFSKIFEDNGMIVKIISAFRKNDMDQLVRSIKVLIDHISSLQVVPEIATIHLDTVMASIIQLLSERTEDMSDVLEIYYNYKKMRDRAGIYEHGELVKEFCQYCNTFSLSPNNNESTDVVAKVARYVDDNFMEPLKIAWIAERFFVNPAYLGQQFYKKKGCSLNNYLNMIRLEKAKELLLNSSHRICEIATKIGYEDPNYFSSKFYEYTGYTPSGYRITGRK